MAGEKPDELFGLMREEFTRRGLLRRAVRLSLGEGIYSVRCDEDCFTIYRVNERPHLPPGLPGWVVCRLSSSECFSLDEDEAVPDLSRAGQGADFHAQKARVWAEMVLARLGRNDNV